jgi:hypothetical protein
MRDVGHPASGNSKPKGVITMIAQKQISATTQRSQLDILSLRMTVAVLRKAVADSSADALTLWKVPTLFAVAFGHCHKPMPSLRLSIGQTPRWLMMTMKRLHAFACAKPLKR